MPEAESESLRKFMVFLDKTRIARGLLKLLLLFKKVKEIFQTDKLDIHAVAQSHLDTCWLWNWDTSKNKIKATFGNNVKRLKKYKDYKFSAPAPAHYEYIERDYPEIFAEIVQFVDQGKWEPVGGMWVESDLTIPCGESLIRQRLHGQRYFLERFGKYPEVAWSPDVFGFPWSLPQIYKKSGARFFYTTKLTWNQQNKFPFPLFHWQSPDGSRILAMNWAYGINKSDFIKKFPREARLLKEGLSDGDKSFSYNDDLEPEDLLEAENFTDDHPREYLFCYGQGDGGHGPYESEIIIVDNLVKLKRGKHSTAVEYFELLEKHADRYPIWNDECYLEVHRGCPTTHDDIKQYNRRCEEMLLSMEKLCTIASLSGFPFPHETFKESWKDLLFNQFHDILPGSSIQHVYYGPGSKCSVDDYERILSNMDATKKSVFEHFYFTGGHSVFFPNQWAANSRIKLDSSGAIKKPEVLFKFGETGEILVGQIGNDVETGKKVIELVAPKGPGIQIKQLHVFSRDYAVPGEIKYTLKSSGDQISYENALYSVRISKASGVITSLKARGSKVDLSRDGLNVLRTFKDEPGGNDAWNIDEHYREKPADIFSVTSVEIIEEGPVLAKIKVIAASDRSRYQLHYLLHHSLPYITCELKIDWHEQHVLLRTEFETSVESDMITTEIPCATIDRPTNPTRPRERAMYEFHGQKWISLSDGTSGLTVINKGRYGFDVSGPRFGMSLLRSPSYPSTNERYPEMAYPEELKQFTDQGENFISWAIAPHDGNWRDFEAWKHAYEFNHQPVVYKNSSKKSTGKTGMLGNEQMEIHVEPSNARLIAFKPPFLDDKELENHDIDSKEYIIRLVEACGQHCRVSIRLDTSLTIKRVQETNLLELEPTGVNAFDKNKIGPIELAPHEIRTLKVLLGN